MGKCGNIKEGGPESLATFQGISWNLRGEIWTKGS